MDIIIILIPKGFLNCQLSIVNSKHQFINVLTKPITFMRLSLHHYIRSPGLQHRLEDLLHLFGKYDILFRYLSKSKEKPIYETDHCPV